VDLDDADAEKVANAGRGAGKAVEELLTEHRAFKMETQGGQRGKPRGKPRK